MKATRGSSSSILLDEGGIDRLSNLPEYVLHHVLSFLETRDVVRTSVLSTRWRWLWTCLANIDLEYHLPPKEKKFQLANILTSFLEFVDKLLIFHDASNIQRLRLRFYMPVDYFRLNCWICAVIKHNIQDLDLNLVLKDNVQYLNRNTTAKGDSGLPLCLFKCNSLTVLKLDMVCALKVPVAAHLSNLRKLHLSSVIFADGISAKRLFDNCQVLDELSLVKCDWVNIENITISIPSLRFLVIEGDTDNKYSDSRVQIVAANLNCLDFASHLDVGFEWSDLCSLRSAVVHNCFAKGAQTRAIRLFREIHNIESLCISGITLKCLMNVEAILDQLPIYHSLIFLMVHGKFFASCSVLLLAFLDKMPELVYLELAEGCQDYTTSGSSEVMQQRVPSCFNSSLRKVTLGYFDGRPHEMALLEYVLRFATCLESLDICCSVHRQARRLSKARNHLYNIPRGSKRCNIKFSFPKSDE